MADDTIAKLAAQREQLLLELSKLKEEIASLHGQVDPDPATKKTAPKKTAGGKEAP